jgi:hypothetical protein
MATGFKQDIPYAGVVYGNRELANGCCELIEPHAAFLCG